VNEFKVSVNIHLRLIGKMLVVCPSALATCDNGFSGYFFAKANCGDKTISRVAVSY
jgi:hypothetical protein